MDREAELRRQIAALQAELAKREAASAPATHTEAFLHSIVENIPDMIFVKDAEELRFVRFNRAGEELLGYTREELIGRNDYDFFPKKEADFFTTKDREVLAGKRLVDIPEEPIQTAAKGRRILHTKKIPILGEEGRPLYLLGISEDITERKRAERQIARLNRELARQVRQLEAAYEELEAFSYSVSHDLRAPLRAIDGFARILVEEHGEQLDDEGRRLLAIVCENARLMGRLIDDILALSRIGRQPLMREPLDPAAIVRSVFAQLREGDPERPVDLQLGPLPAIEGDPTLIRQVLANLLENALKFTRGREPAVVEVGGREEDGEVQLWVRDNGMGFDMRHADKLFRAFQRLHADPAFPGSGVGLATVQRALRRHGGTIRAEGRPGEGATFTLTLPAPGGGDGTAE